MSAADPRSMKAVIMLPMQRSALPIACPLLAITTWRPRASPLTTSSPPDGGVTGSSAPDSNSVGTVERSTRVRAVGRGPCGQTAHASICSRRR